MRQHPLFNRPQLQLAFLYSSVIGSILLIIGITSHFIIQKAFSRVIDRELHLLSNVLNSKLESVLQAPGKLSPKANQIIPELCLPQESCLAFTRESPLHDLIHDGYHVQLLNLQGITLAAITEPTDRFPSNPQLLTSQTVTNHVGEVFHLHLMPLHNEKGEHWGYVQVGRSVRHLDEYMQTLHLLLVVGIPSTMGLIGWVSWQLAGRAMRPIYQSYEQMQQFTADVAHELKTPIATIQAMTETALAAPDHTIADNQTTLRSLHRQNQRLHQLVQDLLLLAKLDYQGSNGKRQAICLNDLVQDITEELAPLAMAADITLADQIQVNHAMTLWGNETQIYRLISNLVTNAINYTPQNGKVILKLDQIANDAIIHIIDTGTGIASQDLPRLFDRFYRVQSDRSRQTGGSGLGLAIAQAIVQAHGGKIQVHSQIDQGSCFTVQLPLKPQRRSSFRPTH
jgi:signal transduction histidine kinase